MMNEWRDCEMIADIQFHKWVSFSFSEKKQKSDCQWAEYQSDLLLLI